jgi:dipeptidase E
VASELLLLSSSRVAGGGYLEYARDAVVEFLDGRHTVHFAPFALADQAGYTAQVSHALADFGVRVVALDQLEPRAAIDALEGAEVLFVGGGNSFRLLKRLQQLELIDVVRRRVFAGELRYMGSSAGSNVACPSLHTTNDMPIVQPASFSAFGLIPFQINPHYVDTDPGSTHMGETREQRIAEFLQEHDVPVLGLREGAWLRRSGNQLTLNGIASGRLFRRGSPPGDIAPRSDLSWLLNATSRFDVPQS